MICNTREAMLLVALMLILCICISPGAAQTNITSIENGDIIYVGEEGLDFSGIDPSITQLAHYSDFETGTVDNIIEIPDCLDFDLLAASVGNYTGIYYFRDSTESLLPEHPCVEIVNRDDTADPVLAEEGEITIVADGETYFIGDEIVLSGVNQQSATVYLFLDGPNLPEGGTNLVNVTVSSGNPTLPLYQRFVMVAVELNDTWEYRWDTKYLGAMIDSGMYTIYAVSQPRSMNELIGDEYATLEISLDKPYVTGRSSSPFILQGDPIWLNGTAYGSPDCVFIWMFGKNYRLLSWAASVEADGSYAFQFSPADTASLADGTYSVFIQHPMMDGMQSPSLVAGTNCILTGDGGLVNLAVFQMDDAIAALIEAMRSPYTDDTYTFVGFSIEEPWIAVDSVANSTPGSTVLVTGTTTLPVGEELLVNVTSGSFGPLTVDIPGETSGMVTVQEGEYYNIWSFAVNTTSLAEGRYGIVACSEEYEVNGTALFYVTSSVPVSDPDSMTLAISPGWNFISTPKRLAEGSNTAAIFQNLDTNGHSVFLYNGSGREWYAMKINDEVRPLDGIWIYSVNQTEVTFMFRSSAALAPPTKVLAPGWNAIGFCGPGQATARDTLFSVSNNWANAIGWDAGDQGYELTIINGGTEPYCDTRLMLAGKGYWLFMKEEGELAALSA